jgi:23S rRNA (pseudouridine1915-N3)-methyltransferase
MISPWHTVSFENIKPVQAKDPAEKMCKEESFLSRRIPPKYYTVALSEEGRGFTTHEFARWLKNREGERGLCLLMGGPYGLRPQLKSRCHEILCLSSLTFPYELCRLIVAEQLFRISSVVRNHPYHKE